MAKAGMVTTSVGANLVMVFPSALFAENAVTVVDSGTLSAAVTWPGVRTPPPEEATDGPDQYAMLLLAMVSAGVPPPVVKSVAETVTVQLAPPTR